MNTPKGWTDEDWQDYEEYFQSLTCQEREIELKSMISLGKAKQRGKNIVVIDQYYEM